MTRLTATCVIALSVLVYSCGPSPSTLPLHEPDERQPETSSSVIDDALVEQYHTFISLAEDHGVQLDLFRLNNLVIRLDSNSAPHRLFNEYDSFAGCNVIYAGNKIVTYAISIDEVYWANATELQKQAILFHKLGHCLLQRKDSTHGIMSKDFLDTEGLTGLQWKAYTDELFTHLNDKDDK